MDAITATIEAGPTLRAMIEHMTGCDPRTDPAFAWSDGEQPCQRCGHHDPTAVVSLDGESFERLCAECLA